MDYSKYVTLWEQLIKQNPRESVEEKIKTRFQSDLKIELEIAANPKSDMLVGLAWSLAENSDPSGLSFYDCLIVCHDIAEKLLPLIT